MCSRRRSRASATCPVTSCEPVNDSGYPGVLTDSGMATLMRRYFDACNEADVEGVAACFDPDAVHYFPPGMYDGPFRGARTIGERWALAVQQFGSIWTVDRI